MKKISRKPSGPTLGNNGRGRIGGGGAAHTNTNHKNSTSRAQANASGYAKRQERKAQRGPSTNSGSGSGLSTHAAASQYAKNGGASGDLYEHIPEKTRRSNVRLDLSRDEALSGGRSRFGLGSLGLGGDLDLDNVDPVQREALRARLVGEVDSEEEVGGGGDGDGDDFDRDRRGKGKGKGKAALGSEDEDEEIDSDAAFEESDEERYAGFFSNKKKKGKGPATAKGKGSVRFAEVNLDEDEGPSQKTRDDPNSSEEEEEDEDGDEDEFIDLVDVLDGKGDIDMGSDDEKERWDEPTTKKAAVPSARLSKSGDSEGEDEDEEDEDVRMQDREDGSDDDEEVIDSGGDDEDEDEEPAGDDQDTTMAIAFSDDDSDDNLDALDQLDNFVSGLDVSSKARKRKAGADGADDEDLENDSGADARKEKSREDRERAKKRRMLVQERTEAGEENEFRVHAPGAKLNLDDLLLPLASSSSTSANPTIQSETLQSLKKSTKILGPSATSTKNKPLSAPLATRAQERLDREAAYEQTKGEVDKWGETMRRIREAEFLSFPLQGPGGAGGGGGGATPSLRNTSAKELLAKFRPTTAMESAVDRLLKKAGAREDGGGNEEVEGDGDELVSQGVSVEEVKKRREELRKMRELAFRAEVKARRVGKIKSKTYRRLRRKERERVSGVVGGDGDGDDLDDDEERMKRETERARERATLKHKHTGKWAKMAKHRIGECDEDTRRDVEAMLERGEKLRRRIQGVGSGSEDEEEESGEDDEGADNDERIRQRAFEELGRLDQHDEDGEPSAKKGKGVFEMKFMKDAMARQALEARKEVDDFVKEMGGHTAGAGSDEDDMPQEDDEQDPSSGVVAMRANGRVVYRPGAPLPAKAKATLAPPPSDTSSVTLQSTDLLSPPPPSPTVNRRSGLSAPYTASQAQADNTNPWLVRDANELSSGHAKKANEVVVSKDSKAMDKSKNRLEKAKMKRVGERMQALDDARVEIDVDDVLVLPPQQTQQQHQQQQQEESDEEVQIQEEALQMKANGKTRGGVKPFEQRELVALAFAGDNVVQNFEEAKKREIAADAPKEVDTTIPGWGSWGGSGVKKQAPKPQRIKKIAGIDPTTRADYGKANIIISEKRDKKAGKYLVKDLPYPYTSKAQFERSMERPLGTEWNTRKAFQRGTLPRVVKKPGIIIEPLEKV